MKRNESQDKTIIIFPNILKIRTLDDFLGALVVYGGWLFIFLALFLIVVFIVKQFGSVPEWLLKFWDAHPIYSTITVCLMTGFVAGGIIAVLQIRKTCVHEKDCFSKQSGKLITQADYDKTVEEFEKNTKWLGDYFDQKISELNSLSGQIRSCSVKSLHRSRRGENAKKCVWDAFAKFIESHRNESGSIDILGTSLINFSNCQENKQFYMQREELEKIYKNHSGIPEAFAHMGGNAGTVSVINAVLEKCKNTKIRMLILHPFCLESFFRAQAERNYYRDKPFPNLTDYSETTHCLHIKRTIKWVRELNSKYKKRIELRLSLFNNAMFLVMFPETCFAQQTVIVDSGAIVGNASVPLIQYENRDNSAYSNYRKHYEYVWARSLPIPRNVCGVGDKWFQTPTNLDRIVYKLYESISKYSKNVSSSPSANAPRFPLDGLFKVQKKVFDEIDQEMKSIASVAPPPTPSSPSVSAPSTPGGSPVPSNPSQTGAPSPPPSSGPTSCSAGASSGDDSIAPATPPAPDQAAPPPSSTSS